MSSSVMHSQMTLRFVAGKCWIPQKVVSNQNAAMMQTGGAADPAGSRTVVIEQLGSQQLAGYAWEFNLIRISR